MIPKTRRNLYVDAPADPQGVGIGITLLLEEATRLGSGEAWLICPQQDQLQAHSHIGQVLGKAIVDPLRKHQPVQVNGIRLVAYTGRQLPRVGNGSPIVAVQTTAELLDKIDDLVEVPSLIVVPYNADVDTRSWREKRNPEIFRPPDGGSQ